MNGGQKDDAPTLIATGALVSIVASLAHEAVGHGLGCAIDGGRITLLTFLVFRCAGAGAIADGGGPVGAFVVGCLALAVVRARKSRSTLLELFLITLGALALLWFWAQMIREAIDATDDWGHVAADLRWSALWRPIACTLGVAGYVATVRVVRRLAGSLAAGRPLRLLTPYLAAMSSAVALGALWHGNRAGSALDGFLSFGVAPLGYLLAIGRTAQGAAHPDRIERNMLWIASVALLWAGFAVSIARGVGPLA